MNKLIEIPPITNPLGCHWEQPRRSEILVDDECALMTRTSFDMLADYSGSQPSALYNGKMWKVCINTEKGPVWLLRFCCNENIEKNYIDIVSREICIL